MNKIFLCFCEDVTATACARIAGVNRNTVNSYYQRIRELIFEESLKEAGKTPVFGLLKRGERVYVRVVENCPRESLMPTMVCAGRPDDMHRRLEDLRRAAPQRLRAPQGVPPRERVRTRKEPCRRHRELLVVREGKAREAQRLRLGQIRAATECE